MNPILLAYVSAILLGMIKMSNGHWDKCNDCGHRWKHEDDRCPECGSGDMEDGGVVAEDFLPQKMNTQEREIDMAVRLIRCKNCQAIGQFDRAIYTFDVDANMRVELICRSCGAIDEYYVTSHYFEEERRKGESDETTNSKSSSKADHTFFTSPESITEEWQVSVVALLLNISIEEVKEKFNIKIKE